MPFSHKCRICDKTLNAESMAELVEKTEEHLLEHVESIIELNHEFLEDIDQGNPRSITETQFGKNQLTTELLEETESEDSTEITEMDFPNYGTMPEENYSEEEQYGEERYILDSMQSMDNN